MRPKYRVPHNKRFFHTKPKMDKRDMIILKRKIDVLNRIKDKKDSEEHLH